MSTEKNVHEAGRGLKTGMDDLDADLCIQKAAEILSAVRSLLKVQRD